MDAHTSSTRHLAPGGSRFAVTQSFADSIAIVDLAARPDPVVIETITVGTAPWGIACHPGSNRAFVATARSVAVVDLASSSVLKQIPYRAQPAAEEYGEYRAGGTGIVVSLDGLRVYVGVHRTDLMSTVEIMDVEAGEVIDSVDIGERPFDVQISPDGAVVYSIDHDSFTVNAVSTADHEVITHIVAPFGMERGKLSSDKLHYAAVADDGTLYLPFQGRGFVEFDPRDGTYSTAAMTADTHQHGIALTDDGRALVSGVGPGAGTTQPASLTIRDIASGVEILVPLRHGHETVSFWVEPVTGRKYAVLAGGSTSTAPWDGLSLVDLETLEVTEHVVPGRPQVLAAIG